MEDEFTSLDIFVSEVLMHKVICFKSEENVFVIAASRPLNVVRKIDNFLIFIPCHSPFTP